MVAQVVHSTRYLASGAEIQIKPCLQVSRRVGLFLTCAEVPYGLTETLDGACLRMLFYTNCLDLSNLCFLDWTVSSEDARTLSVLPARLEAPREQGSGLLCSPVSSWCSAPTATYGCWRRVYGIHQWIVPRTLNFRVIFYLYLELFFFWYQNDQNLFAWGWFLKFRFFSIEV